MKASYPVRTFLFVAVALGLVLLAGGCATAAAKSTSVASFSTGVSAAKLQTQTTFDTVATFTRNASLDDAASADALNEGLFVTVPDAAASKAWLKAFDLFDRYAQHLSALASGGASADIEKNVGDLAKGFNTASQELKTAGVISSSPQLSAKPVAAFAALADTFLKLKGEKDALAFARQADPGMQAAYRGLAECIGTDANSGLRETVRETWNHQLIAIAQGFLQAKPAGAASGDQKVIEARKPIAQKYADTLAKRDAMDGQLASLQGSYTALASAHAAIAQGSEADLQSAVAFVRDELKHARDLQTQYEKTLAK